MKKEDKTHDRTVDVLDFTEELNDFLLEKKIDPSIGIPALLFAAASGAIFTKVDKKELINMLSEAFDSIKEVTDHLFKENT